MTHNATGEGIYQAMQSGVYAAEAVAEILSGADEQRALSRYTWRCRERFTFGFAMGHVVRAALKTPIFDGLALAYNSPLVRRVATWAVGSALAGSSVSQGSPPVERPTVAAPRPTVLYPRAAAN